MRFASRRCLLAVALGVGVGVGCSSGEPFSGGPASGGHHSSTRGLGSASGGLSNGGGSSSATSGTGGAGGSGSAGSTSATGSSGGQSSGGVSSSSGGQCPALGGQTLGDCPPDQIEILGQIVDYCQSLAPISSGVQISDGLSPNRQISADSCGFFHTCSAPGSSLALRFDSLAYAPTDLPFLVPARSAVLASSLKLVCNAGFQQLTSQVGDYQTDGGALFGVVTAANGTDRCGDPSNWTVGLHAADGGSVTGAQTIFLSGAGVAPGATGTTSLGVVVVYDIDPQFSPISLSLEGSGNLRSDGGPQCFDDSASALQFSNQLPIRAGRFSDFDIILRAAP